MRARSIGVRLILAIAAATLAAGPALAWRSSLYPPYWTPGYADGQGRFLHDFSYAGYHRSEATIPSIAGPILNVAAQYGADPTGSADCTAAIQLALDDAATSGGAVVYLPAGLYRCDGQLIARGDRTIVRGQGPAASRLWFTLATAAVAYGSHLGFQGDVQWGADLPLTSDGAELSFDVYVADASSLSVGQDIAVGWVITDAFIAEHGMTGIWTQFNGQWRPFFRRKVAALDLSMTPHKVTVDIPLRYPAKTRDLASIRPLVLSPTVHGYLRECAVEDLAVSNAVDPAVALSLNQVHAIGFYETQDCWLRNVQSFASPAPIAAGAHLQSSGIIVQDSDRVTVDQCVMQNCQNHGSGGNGYLFEVMRTNEALYVDCVGAKGRHNFIQNWDFGTTGCVWLRCSTSGATNEFGTKTSSEYHHSLAMACLVDSCSISDGWQGGNRGTQSSGAGHAVTQSAYWNSTGAGSLGSWNYGWGYVIGTSPALLVTTGYSILGYDVGTAPEDFKEGLANAASLEPQSLFEDQLRKRTVNQTPAAAWSAYD